MNPKWWGVIGTPGNRHAPTLGANRSKIFVAGFGCVESLGLFQKMLHFLFWVDRPFMHRSRFETAFLDSIAAILDSSWFNLDRDHSRFEWTSLYGKALILASRMTHSEFKWAHSR